MKRKLFAGSTSQIIPIFAQDTTSNVGTGLAGLTNATAGLTAKYRRQGQPTWTTIPLCAATAVGTYTNAGAAGSGGGFLADGGVAGSYELSMPDAALASATGVAWVIVQLSGATNLLPVLIEIELDAINYQDANAAGLTAIGTLTTSERNAAADALLDRANSIETGKTLRQALKIIAAILAGKVSGAGTNTEIFRAIDDSAARATVTADASGNRSEIAYNV
jgi:hypothetical protein